ncbi:MAG: helix-turn-helix transcriptional regulator [Thermoplasmata archaeon]
MTKWRDLRKSLGLTQSWVADRVGISRTALSHIERGKSTPSPGTQEALRRVPAYGTRQAAMRQLLH